MAYGDLKCNNLIYETGSGDVTIAINTIPSTAGATFTGDVTLTGAANNVVWDVSDNALEFADNAKAVFGTGSDAELYHNGSHTYLSNTEGSLFIKSSSQVYIQDDQGRKQITCVDGGAVELYHGGVDAVKLATSSTGVDVTGTATVDGVDIAGPYKQTVVAITQSATPTVDLSTGNYFTLTQNANVTQWTFSNPPASRSFSFVIELANASHTTAWSLASGTIKWPADTAPTLSASKTHLIILTTDDGGTTYRAASIVDYTT